MRWNEIVRETASGGATGSGNVASLPGGAGGKGAIGVGFDPNGYKGIYDAQERRKKRRDAPKGRVARR